MAAAVNEERLAGDVKFFNRYTVIGGLYGVTSSSIYNALLRRPVIAGFHKHIIGVTIGMFVGYKVAQWQDRKWAETVYLMGEYRERNSHLFNDEPSKTHMEFEGTYHPRT